MTNILFWNFKQQVFFVFFVNSFVFANCLIIGLGIAFQVTNEVTSTVVVKYGVISFIWSELLINELYTSEYLPQITSGCYCRIYFFVNFAYKSLLFKLNRKYF